MVEDSGGPAFPVAFFDGEKEMNIGSVKIYPALQYKPFQLMLSQKIGISPNQISIYLVDTRKVPALPFIEYRRRIPITGKVNFGLICRQKDCRFLVVLKRSRKSRNRRERVTNGVEFSDDFILDRIEFSSPPPPPKSLILLKRNQPSPFDDRIPPSELAALNDQLQRFRFQRETYPLASGKGGEVNPPNFVSGHGTYLNPGLKLEMDPFPEFVDDYTKNFEEKLFCEDCVNADCKGKTPSFHPCVRDAVISRFSTRLGPISRPIKQHPL